MSIIQLPKAEREVIVETANMRRTVTRTVAVHRGSGLVVWHGRSRLGKTTTARWLVEQINQQYRPDNPDAFRVIHYETGEIHKWSGNKQKQGIRSLYHATVGRLDEGLYRQLPPEELARQLVHGMQRNGIQMALVDEAGCLSLEAIRGMVLVRDTAELMGWTLSLIFVGMDDLPIKMEALPQIAGRVHEWCYFEPYSLDETWELLKKLHPHFAELDGCKSAHREQVDFIHEQYGGVPGVIVPFVRKLNHRLQDYDGEVDLTLLRAVHLLTLRDKTRALEDAKTRYKGKPSVKVDVANKSKRKSRNESKPQAETDSRHSAARVGNR